MAQVSSAPCLTSWPLTSLTTPPGCPRYESAPIWSTNYPDKNQQAIALDVSIITHRYLIEASTLPYSLILHFQDIASIHIVVLKVRYLRVSLSRNMSPFIDLSICSFICILYATPALQEHFIDFQDGLATSCNHLLISLYSHLFS